MIPSKKITSHLTASDFGDARFMSAAEKLRTATDWEKFVRARCAAWPAMVLPSWTETLYDHFSLHLGHIAHFNRHGFFDAQWQQWNDFLRNMEALAQDMDNMGGPLSQQAWGANEDYEDLGRWIVEVAQAYLEDARAQCTRERKQEAGIRLAAAQKEYDEA